MTTYFPVSGSLKSITTWKLRWSVSWLLPCTRLSQNRKLLQDHHLCSSNILMSNTATRTSTVSRNYIVHVIFYLMTLSALKCYHYFSLVVAHGANWSRSPDFMIFLLKTYIRPILEYCSSLWNTGYLAPTSVRKVISRSKCTEQICSPAAEQNFWMRRYKTFLLMRMRKQMMNIYLPIYNNVYQSSSIIMSPHWQKIAQASAGGLHRHRPAVDSRGLSLCLPLCTRPSTPKGYARAGDYLLEHLQTTYWHTFSPVTCSTNLNPT